MDKSPTPDVNRGFSKIQLLPDFIPPAEHLPTGHELAAVGNLEVPKPADKLS